MRLYLAKQTVSENCYNKKQSSWQARLASAGHAYAMQTASSRMSRQARIEYAYSGLPALVALKSFLASAQADDSLWDTLCHRLSELHQTLISLPKQVLLVCEEQVSPDLLDEISKHISTKKKHLHQVKSISKAGFDTLDELLCQQDEPKTAWLISSNVYYNAAAYQATTSEHEDTPALMVLAPFFKKWLFAWCYS